MTEFTGEIKTAETPPLPTKVTIHPRRLGKEERYAIRPHYTSSPYLVSATAIMKDNMHFDKDLEAFEGYRRNPGLEKLPVKEGELSPKEIADANLREMARATSQNWYFALHRMFSDTFGESVDFPLHNRDQRMRIAIPGGHFAFEVGGILRFFNEQQIPVDIDVVDIHQTGQEKESMDLDSLLQQQASTVNFYSHTDANDYFKGGKYDLAVLRHPGPVWTPNELDNWKNIIHTVATTDPTMIVFSTYDHPVEDDAVKKAVGLQDKSDTKEYDVLNILLEKEGFKGNPNTIFFHELLTYPRSIYMTSARLDRKRNFLIWDDVVDPLMELYVNPQRMKIKTDTK